MGNGLLIDLYERQDIQIDHHCDGALFKFHTGPLALSGFNAIARWDDNSIVRGISPQISIWNFRVGGEYAKIIPRLSPAQELVGGFFAFDMDFLSLYYEIGSKHPLAGLQKDGQGMYGSASIFTDWVSIMIEYKDYDQFAIRNTYMQYNNPPTLIMEPLYTLPSRHLRELNLADEIGYSTNVMSYFGPIGIEILYSYAQEHQGENKFSQIWSEMEYHNNDETLVAKLALDIQFDKQEKYYTPIVDITYEPDWTNFAFNIIGEYQRAEDYNNAFGSIAVSHPKIATFGLEGGIISSEEDKHYIRAYSDMDISSRAKVRLGIGKRPGGFTCSGGVCRYEEKFEGVEAGIILTY
ncbi:hypothetical protein DRQ33_07745 [bacterium]|nr:MAG: hypothetical protein DRQ33_07745 [bacterium]